MFMLFPFIGGGRILTLELSDLQTSIFLDLNACRCL